MHRPGHILTTLACTALTAPCLQAVDLGTIDIHGFVSQGWFITQDNNWLAPESTDGSFEFNEAAINASTDLTDSLRLGLQLFARDLGRLGNNEVVIDWAYADWQPRQEFGLRLGRIKNPQGLYNETLDIDAARIPILLPGMIYSPTYRDVLANNGIQVYGNLTLGDGGDLDYKVYAGAVSLTTDSSMTGLFTNNGYLLAVDVIDTEFSYGLSTVWNTPLDGLRCGVSVGLLDDFAISGPGVVGFDPSTGPIVIDLTYRIDLLQLYVGSLEYSFDDWTFAAEYARRRFDLTVADFDFEFDQEAWYCTSSYQVDPRWSITVSYGELYSDRDHRTDDPAGYQRDLSLALRCDINRHWLAKAEYHWLDGHAYAGSDLNPDGLEETWGAFFLKTTLTF